MATDDDENQRAPLFDDVRLMGLLNTIGQKARDMGDPAAWKGLDATKFKRAVLAAEQADELMNEVSECLGQRREDMASSLIIRVRDEVARRQMSNTELASELGMSRQNTWTYLTGRQKFGPKIRARLEEWLATSQAKG